MPCICIPQRILFWFIFVSDSKPLRDLLNSSEQEEICELLDAPVCGKLPYEAIARWYGATHNKIKARLQEGKSEAVIEWLVAERPELTVGEFATVVKEKARRTDAADKLKAFDAKATKESIDAAWNVYLVAIWYIITEYFTVKFLGVLLGLSRKCPRDGVVIVQTCITEVHVRW